MKAWEMEEGKIYKTTNNAKKLYKRCGDKIFVKVGNDKDFFECVRSFNSMVNLEFKEYQESILENIGFMEAIAWWKKGYEIQSNVGWKYKITQGCVILKDQCGDGPELEEIEGEWKVLPKPEEDDQ